MAWTNLSGYDLATSSGEITVLVVVENSSHEPVQVRTYSPVIIQSHVISANPQLSQENENIFQKQLDKNCDLLRK